MSATNADITYVEGWEEKPIADGYRIVGVQHGSWFVQGPLNNVVAHPPVHLTILEAIGWFLHQQNERKER